MALRRLAEAAKRAFGVGNLANVPTTIFPLEEEQRLYAAHNRAPLDRHLDILCGDYRIGERRFIDLFRECMDATGTVVTPFNVFQRFETRVQFCKYLLATLDVPGMRAECGVYRGATALLLCHAIRSSKADFRGEGMHLIDSFSGTSESVDEDLIAVRESDGTTKMQAFFPAGKTDTSADLVHGFFAAEFPRVQIHAGWVPDVFATVPDGRWAFAHIDLTLFEPTLAALEYFYPRLSQGGVIVCDGSIFCPGAEAAVRQFCERDHIPYALLGHREYVLIT
jgi:hypothetical protein